jgi:microcin C transport system permease protein
MSNYILKRILLIIPTLLGILLLNFCIIQFAPGGPVEHTIAKLTSQNQLSNNLTANNNEVTTNLNHNSKYSGSKGLDPEIIAEIEKLYGFDKNITVRFFTMLKDFLRFDFGESFFKGEKVINLITTRLPVSISLGLWSTLIIYLISIPLGIKKALNNGSKFDFYSSLIIFVGYSIPAFLFAILLLLLFAKGGTLPIFPIGGLTSDDFNNLSFIAKIKDYFLHIALPLISLVIGGFATLTMLTKNSFIAEIQKQYVVTAQAKGLTSKDILYGHIFRNAMILVISQIPETLVKILFTGVLLIEIIFSLDGLGLLGFEAIINRDYPIIFATLYIYTLIGLVFNLVSDIIYVLIDPRINFENN